MSRPITLWDHKRHAKQTTDDAGTTIIKSIIPSGLPIPGPYEAQTEPFVFVPSLTSLVITKLSEYPDQLHALEHIRLRYQAPSSRCSHDILRELIPGYEPDAPDFNLQKVDPRLWATLVQVFSDLPDTFKTYRIPLSDKHVPLLQRIPSTSHFTFVTILDLPRCKELTDNTILELKSLSSLCALDASETSLSGYGIKSLSMTLGWKDTNNNHLHEKRGPWGLRILNLRNCRNVNSDIFDCLRKFLLLSLLDLRGTNCNTRAWKTSKFKPSASKIFFYPTPLPISLDLLSSISLGDASIFSSSQIYTLHITSLNHSIRPRISHSWQHSRLPPENSSVNVEDNVEIPSQDRAEARTEDLQPSITMRRPSTTLRLSSIVDGSPSFSTTSPMTASVASVAIEAILKDEARIEATERSVSSFYSMDSTTRAGLPRWRLPMTMSLNCLQTIRPGQDDLMLFRDPPPWGILEAMEPPEITNSGKLHTSRGAVATVGWSNGKGAKGMQALAEMVRMRQQYATSRSTTIIANEPKPINPFRGEYPHEVITTPDNQRVLSLAPSSRAPLSNSITPSLAQKPPPTTSTLDTPVVSEEMCSEKRRSRTSVPESPKRRKVANTDTIKEVTKHSPISKPRTKPPVVDLPWLSPSTSASRSLGKNVIKASGSETSSKTGDGGFDWKKWSNS